MTDIVTLYETNSDVVVISLGNPPWVLKGSHHPAWSLGPVTPDQTGKFAEDAQCWIENGNVDALPGDWEGQSRTFLDDDLTPVAQWTPGDGVTLLVERERLGGAARLYLNLPNAEDLDLES